MKQHFAVFILLTVMALAAGCTSAATDGMPLGIKVERTGFTPLMSSTVGIGMAPVYPSSIGNDTVRFRWQTNYGYFLSWEAPDFKVGNNGTDVTTTDRKVYWSYDPEDMGKEKPPVRVTLTMVDRTTGRALNTTGLDIGWEGGDFARVIAQ